MHRDQQEPSSQTMVDRLKQHADLLSLQSGHFLLEVGCGTGKTTGWLTAQVAPGRLTAVDFSSAMINYAKQKDIDAEFLCMDVCRDHLENDTYDVILCFHSFPHFRDQSAALCNFASALKSSGRLIIMHLAGSRQINEFHAGMDAPVREDVLPSGDEWRPLLEESGLREVKHVDRDDLFYLEARIST